jgi:peptidoglycan hydrolase-like protein with peptidoglycan-binding domain
MAIQSLDSNIAQGFRDFASQSATLSRAFDPSRSTTKEHATALKQFNALYGAVSKDGSLSKEDQQDLLSLMTGTNNAGLDAFADNLTAATYGAGTAYDPGYYSPSDAKAGAETVATAQGRVDGEATTSATATEPNLAADGRIVYDAAPSFADVRAGSANLGIGQKSAEVGEMQQALQDGGFFGANSTGNADQMFGPKTQEAVKKWQAANNMTQTGALDGASLDRLLGKTTAPVETEEVAAAGTDKAKDGFQDYSVSAEAFQVNKADIFAGTTENVDIKNLRGDVLLEDGVHEGIGAEYNATVIGVKANVGDANDVGIAGRAAIETDLYIGGETNVSKDGIALKAGAYAGNDAVGEWGFGARYFGIGGKHTVGVGVGGTVEGHATNKDGRLSLGGFAKAGAGISSGHGGELWIDYGKIQEDAKAFGTAVSDGFTGAVDATVGGFNDATKAVGDFFSGIDFGRE